jgi:predicted acylesterase/phospholipase RssA
MTPRRINPPSTDRRTLGRDILPGVRSAVASASDGSSRIHQPLRKMHKAHDRPPFEYIALLLQGGGALGAYQAGVYEALSEVGGSPAAY